MIGGCSLFQSQSNADSPQANARARDTQYMMQGTSQGSTTVFAPSQLHIGLPSATPARVQQNEANEGDSAAAQANNAATPPDMVAGGAQAEPGSAPAAIRDPVAAQLVPEARSYLGTMPCFSQGEQCQAQRLTLTVAPNGQWRSRTTYISNTDSAPQPLLQQGCWNTVDSTPVRLVLNTAAGNSTAEFSAVANNVLQVVSINSVRPNLTYHLTRQPDLDPISDLQAPPPLQCPTP